ncbi:MAG: clostripain-related cysteine peptidase [Candidatus Thermoplasmatota archaeon]
MNKLKYILPFFFFAFVALLFTLGNTIAEEQNDAGSGRDAGQSIAGSISISVDREYKGALFPNSGDFSDIYKFNVPSEKIVDINVKVESYGNYIYVILLDSNDREIASKYSSYSTEIKIKQNVNAGNYYLNIKTSGSSNQKIGYSFKITFASMPRQNDANSWKDAGSTIATSILVKADWYNGFLAPSFGDNSDIFKFTAKDNETIQIAVFWDKDAYGGTTELLGRDGNVLLSGQKEGLEFVAKYTGEYYLNIKYSSSWSSSDQLNYSFAIKLIGSPDDLFPQPRKLWTYLMYVSASGGLGAEAFWDIDNFQDLGSTSKVNLLVLYDGDTHGDSKLLYFTQQRTIKRVKLSLLDQTYTDGMELNMGDPNLAIAFMKFAIKYLPAEHYAIVFYGHAGGGGGFAKDTDPYDKITTPEVSIVFSPIKAIVGKNFDLVVIDSCWAGSIENYYELSDYADYAVASEPMMTGMPFGTIVRNLMRNPWIGGYELAVIHMSIYNEYNSNKPDNERNFVNAIDLGALKTILKEKLNKFVDTLTTMDSKKIIEIREKTKSASSGNYKDLGHFALLCKDVNELKNQATETFNAIKKTVVQEHYHPPKDYYGISIYFPYESHSGYYSDHFQEYKEAKFARETKWVKLLEYIMIGGIELELGIPKSNLFKLEDRTSIDHYYAIKMREYTGNDPFVIMIKTDKMEDLERIQIKVLINMGDFYHADWQEALNSNQNKNGIFVIPQEKMRGSRQFKIILTYKGNINDVLPYSIAAYGEFEKVDENNIEQIAWANGASTIGKFDKTNEEKYYFVLIPANKKINIKLKCTSARDNETDFDLYVGLAQPQGTGLPRIYQFDYRGFTIDANETVPMKGALGPYNNEVKVYILVRAYQGKGNYNLVIRDAI